MGMHDQELNRKPEKPQMELMMVAAWEVVVVDAANISGRRILGFLRHEGFLHDADCVLGTMFDSS